MRRASGKKFLSSCCKCSSLHPRRPKAKERCAKPVAGKRLAENIGTPMYLSASVRVFVYSKTELILCQSNVSGGTLRESDFGVLFDIV